MWKSNENQYIKHIFYNKLIWQEPHFDANTTVGL